MFGYANNNPIKYTDPDGRVAVVDDATAVVVAAGLLLTAGVISIANNRSYKDAVSDLASQAGELGKNIIDGTIEAGKWIGEKIAGLFSKGDKAKPKTKDKQEDKTNRNNEQLPKPKYPGDDPTKAPVGTEWRGKPGSKPGDEVGNYHNLNTGKSYRPDLNHDSPICPHWDYKDPNGKWYRIFPDGTVMEK